MREIAEGVDQECEASGENALVVRHQPEGGPQTSGESAGDIDWEQLARAVHQPVAMLQPNPRLMSGGNPACTSVPEISTKPPPLHFYVADAGESLFEDCVRRSKTMLKEYAR
jgi:hypothetical protein